MLPGDAPPVFLAQHALHPVHAPATTLDRPRKPRSNGGPEGPWWKRPVRPE